MAQFRDHAVRSAGALLAAAALLATAAVPASASEEAGRERVAQLLAQAERADDPYAVLYGEDAGHAREAAEQTLSSATTRARFLTGVTLMTDITRDHAEWLLTKPYLIASMPVSATNGAGVLLSGCGGRECVAHDNVQPTTGPAEDGHVYGDIDLFQSAEESDEAAAWSAGNWWNATSCRDVRPPNEYWVKDILGQTMYRTFQHVYNFCYNSLFITNTPSVNEECRTGVFNHDCVSVSNQAQYFKSATVDGVLIRRDTFVRKVSMHVRRFIPTPVGGITTANHYVRLRTYCHADGSCLKSKTRN